MKKLKPMEVTSVIFHTEILGVKTDPRHGKRSLIEVGKKYFLDLWKCTKIKSIEPQMVVVEFEHVGNKKGKIGLRSERVFFQIPFELIIQGEFDPIVEKKVMDEKKKNAKFAKKIADNQKKGKFPPIPKKLPKLPKALKESAKVE